MVGHLLTYHIKTRIFEQITKNGSQLWMIVKITWISECLHQTAAISISTVVLIFPTINKEVAISLTRNKSLNVSRYSRTIVLQWL